MIKVNVDEAAAYLRTADNCLIYTHTNPDADTIGSAARSHSRSESWAGARESSAPTRSPRG